MKPSDLPPAAHLVRRETVFSSCRQYRYSLWREWETPRHPRLFVQHEGSRLAQYLMVIGLNPSTADETNDDPTIRRCIDFAKRWGFGALCMANLFAWRDTDPSKMKFAPTPVGLDNDTMLLNLAKGAGMVLAAWGKHGSHRNRSQTVCKMLADANVQLHCLKRNKDGSPMHPLYVAADTVAKPYIP